MLVVHFQGVCSQFTFGIGLLVRGIPGIGYDETVQKIFTSLIIVVLYFTQHFYDLPASGSGYDTGILSGLHRKDHFFYFRQ